MWRSIPKLLTHVHKLCPCDWLGMRPRFRFLDFLASCCQNIQNSWNTRKQEDLAYVERSRTMFKILKSLLNIMQSLQESQVRRRRLKTSKKKHSNHLSVWCYKPYERGRTSKRTRETIEAMTKKVTRKPIRLIDSPPPSFLAWEDPMQPILETFGRVNWKLLRASELATRAQTLPPGLIGEDW